MGSLATQKRRGWTPPSPATPVCGPLRTWSERSGVPVSRVSGEPSGAQASMPSRALSTPGAVARHAGPLASSLSFRAESRRLRASWTPSVISPPRRTPLGLPSHAEPHAVSGARRPRQARDESLVHRDRLPRDGTVPRSGRLPGPHLPRVPPPRGARLRSPPVPGRTSPLPKRRGHGSSLYEIVILFRTALIAFLHRRPSSSSSR